MDWSWITARLATGGGISTEQDLQSLITSGVTHIIDCRMAPDPIPQDALFGLRTGATALYPSKNLYLFKVKGVNISYLYNPTEDDGQPKPVSWFKASLDFALSPLANDVLVSQNRARVYAHCDAGHNRGPSTAYCILRALTGMNHDDAKALIELRHLAAIGGIAYANDADRALTELGYLIAY